MAHSKHEAFRVLTSHLQQLGYTFICPSPESQGRVMRKLEGNPVRCAKTLEDVFGWNLPVEEGTLKKFLPSTVFDAILDAEIITYSDDKKCHANIRISNFYLPHVDQRERKPTYYIHSSFPTTSSSVFFGPDTYLYLDFLDYAGHHILQSSTIVDVCCGSGAGAIHMAQAYPNSKVIGLDLNPKALEIAAANAACSNKEIQFIASDLYRNAPKSLVETKVDLIISNPPYIATAPSVAVYADGGAQEGLELSVRILQEGLEILTDNGLIMIYTGVAIPVVTPSYDAFLEAVRLTEGAELLEYRIIHPDMWPEEIGSGAYAEIGRIQVVGAVIRKRNITIVH